MNQWIKTLIVCLLGIALCCGFSLFALADEAQSIDTAVFTPLTLDKSVEVTIQTSGNSAFFSFTPTQSGYYTFVSSGSLNTKGILYNSDKEVIAHSETSRNFTITKKLIKETTYYFSAQIISSDSSTGTFNVKLQKSPLTGTLTTGHTWSFTEGRKLTISGSGNMPEDTFTFPWSIFQNDIEEIEITSGVTSISSWAFESFNALTQVIIADSVTAIGRYAFYTCRALKTCPITSHIATLGDSAFANCDALTSVSLPNVTSMGSSAFRNCKGLTSVTLGSGLETISDSAFAYCAALKEVNIASGVTQIGSYAFSSCTLLNKIELPASVTMIGSYAFDKCTALKQATLPDHLIQIGKGVFNGCKSLVSIVIPGTVSRIENNAFYDCSALTSITLENGVNAIGASAFENCSAIIALALPPTVTVIEENAFAPVQYVETDLNNTYYQQLLSITQRLTADCGSNTEKTRAILAWIRENVTYSLTSLCIGETPEQAYAVYVNGTGNCQGFIKLAGFMLSLVGIPNGAIVNKSHMWNVVLLDGKWVMLDAQYGASAFTANYSDELYSEIKYIIFAQGDNIYVVVHAGEVKLAGDGADSLEEKRSGITHVEIPDFVDSIFGYAFSYCPDLETVTIPGNVTSIGIGTFQHCPKLTRVTIPASVTSLGENAFSYSRQAVIYCEQGSAAHAYAQENNIPYRFIGDTENTLVLPASLQIIDSQAFDGIYVSAIQIPVSVTSIADDAFSGTDAILLVVSGSYAEDWAKAHGRNYIAQ